jgi:hypothetical protein
MSKTEKSDTIDHLNFKASTQGFQKNYAESEVFIDFPESRICYLPFRHSITFCRAIQSSM